MSRTIEVGAQKESQEELPGTKNKRKQRKQHMEETKTNSNKTTQKDTGGRLMPVYVFRCFGVMVLVFWCVGVSCLGV